MTIIRIEADNTDIHAYNHHRILYLLVFKKAEFNLQMQQNSD